MFGFLVTIFDFVLYQPLFNGLIIIYDYFPVHDFGLAIIILTLIIRLILYPLSAKATKSQKALNGLQSKIQEIQKKYKDDKEKQAIETLALYKTEKINPFSGLFLALIQLPILIALYRVFWLGLKPEELNRLYDFVLNPVSINASFLGMMDLSKPNFIFAVLAGICQFFQTKMLTPKKDSSQGKTNEFAQAMQNQMLYFFPVFTVIILMSLPSAIGLYWIASGVFTIVQQYFTLKNNPKN
jgi:YidC/Oxa1 family membrane protein insertase